MDKVITEPDFYKPMETYVPVKPDWSDLNKVVEKVLANYKDYEYIIDNSIVRHLTIKYKKLDTKNEFFSKKDK